jgi:DNA-binding response OmpR family regulator
MDGHASGVLIADPDEAARLTLARVLRTAGYQVLQAETGDEALALARTAMPAAVILEVPLPGLSGYEVCHALKSDPGGDVPVIFLSGHRTESYDRVAGLLLGADDYILKPYTAGELLARLTNLIRRSRSRTVGVPRRLTKRELEVLELLGVQARLPLTGRIPPEGGGPDS